MKAAILTSPNISKRLLRIEQVPQPSAKTGQVLLRVRACGVCRTDLNIAEGELPPREELIPGHQIVGEIVDGVNPELPLGTRVGVSWMGGIDGTCYALARADFVFPVPTVLDDLRAAPLLCAGIIGFRSLRVAGVEHVNCAAWKI